MTKKELETRREKLKEMGRALQQFGADIKDITLSDDGQTIIIKHENDDVSMGIGAGLIESSELEIADDVLRMLWRRADKRETKTCFVNQGEDFAVYSGYDVTICCDTEEETRQIEQFLKHRAFWHPAAEAPEKDGYYLVTVAGWYIGCREPFVVIHEYRDGEWDIDEEAVLAWAPLPEPYGGMRKVC